MYLILKNQTNLQCITSCHTLRIDSAIEVAQTHLPAGRENGCKIPGKGRERDEDLFGSQQGRGARQEPAGGIRCRCSCGAVASRPPRGATAEHAAFSTALFLSQVRLKMLCDTVIDSNLGINTSPQAPAQLIICIINTHIK